MRVAVLSLTRDRLWATQHCFATLRELAGCPFDHYVLDNGSQDGTQEWLKYDYPERHDLVLADGNMGVSRGMNVLLDRVALAREPYDVIVKVDNDLELLVPDTLKACCEIASDGGYISSPHIQGLNSPPSIERRVDLLDLRSGNEYRVGIPNLLGGIFMAAPAFLYQSPAESGYGYGYRHDPANPVWGLDDAKIVDHWRALGNEVCYLLDFKANHFLTTEGQAERDPSWYSRKVAEFHGA